MAEPTRGVTLSLGTRSDMKAKSRQRHELLSWPASRVGYAGMRWKLDEVTRAGGRWRDAARVVAMRWDTYLGCEAPLRPLAYSSYLAALDAEEAAAAEVAKFTRHAE